MRAALYIAAISVLASSAVAQSSKPSQLSELIDAQQDKLKTCLSVIDERAKAKKITPERYVLVVTGACLNEGRLLQDQVTLAAISGYVNNASEAGKFLAQQRAVRDSALFSDGQRARYISEYTLWFAEN